MTIEMKKVWFVDGQIIEQEIPESDIYKRHWNIDACKEYVKQLRDKTRANTAEHAAEAIEFLLTECDALMALAQPCPTCEALARTVMLDQTSHDNFKPDYNTEAVLVEEMQRMAKRIQDLEAMLERQTSRIVELQEHIENFDGEDR